MTGEFKIYRKYIKMHFLSGLEYKGWWLMVLQVMIAVITDQIGTFFMFSRFGGVGEWSLERILLIYSLAVTSFGLAESFCRGFDYFPWKMLRSGDFDRLLLRPRSLVVQVAGSFFHIHRLARVVTGTCVIIWALSRLGVEPSLFSVSVIVLALIGGTLTYCGVFVMSSGIAFFTIKALDWIYIFTNASLSGNPLPNRIHAPYNAHNVYIFHAHAGNQLLSGGGSVRLGWQRIDRLSRVPGGICFFSGIAYHLAHRGSAL